jgi:hypothetical protein
VDLSGIIFVALAIAWAVYLIPKALQHHDEIARSRGVDKFSARMRVFGGAPSVEAADAVPNAVPNAVPDQPAVPAEPVQRVVVARSVTRESARRAAARRRTVLYVLTALTVLTAVLGWRGYAPTWTVAVPLVLVVAFLAIARRTVRREQVRRVVVASGEDLATPAPVAKAETGEAVEAVEREDTVGLRRAELAEPDALPLEDEGSLWDPLPVTLPTYVSKPRARRTVRTIELTQTAQSSGHDPVDSALVRQAEAAEAAALEQAPEALEEPTERRAAGA